jgi:hypothetical protein
MSFFFFLGGEFNLVVLPSLCGGCVFVFDVPLIGTGGYWVGGVCCVAFLTYVGVAFPLDTFLMLPLSLEGAEVLFPIFVSSPGLVGESPF